MIWKIPAPMSDLLRYRDLLSELVIRDIKVRYRRSLLGLAWTILNPLMMMLVISFVFSTLFKQDIPSFPIYYLSGSLLFSFNAEVTSNALLSVSGNAALIKKVYIPKYLFPLSKVVSGLVNLGFSFIAMLCVMAFTRAPFYPTLLLVPIPVIYLFMFSLGLGLILATVTVFFQDIAHLYSVLITAWGSLTPIFYPETILPHSISWVLRLNPMHYYIRYFRDLILYNKLPDLQLNLTCCITGLITMLIGRTVFALKQDRFILYI